jgi:hypothetical protein
MTNWWLKDQDGNPSVIVTLVLVSFIATTSAYVLSIVDKLGPISIRPFDVGAAGAYFGTVLACWVGHAWVNKPASAPQVTGPVAVVPPAGS